MNSSFVFSVIFLLLGSFFSQIFADPVEDKLALLDFVKNLPHGRSLNWHENSSVCNNWIGVTCSSNKSRIVAVHLPGVGFNGKIPPNTLSRLSALQTLSLRSNGLTGPFPSDFSNLKHLIYLYLQANSFAGRLPSDFSVWKNLTVVDLSSNAFNGSIPSSISNLTQLTTLNFANNSLSGVIPNLKPPNLQSLNLSHNNLTGVVPESLQRFPESSFFGNNLSFANLSVVLLSPLYPPLVAPSPIPRTTPRNPRKISDSAILGIIVGGCALVFVVSAFLLIVVCSKRKGAIGGSGKLPKGERSRSRSAEKAVSGSQDENNRLVFFEGSSYAFDLEDLLRASAEVLGKGTFGTAYKAVLEDATMVVVKRLKEVGVGKREFEQQMEMVGRIRHENVAALRAYYYSKDEKLMVYDYYDQGSISSMLHGKSGEARTPLDWDTRIRIALGTARGITRIHAENTGKPLVHGNIKSSNIFFNSQQYGCVSDLGLTAMMNPPMPPPLSRSTGYRAPEVTDARKASQPSDVYSFGVLLFELLTGKSPIQTPSGGDEAVHLVRWVQSVVKEEWTAEVFDVELMKYPNIEEEMVEMLQIAMACVVRMPDQRPKMPEVVKMIEDVRPGDTGNRPSSGAKSDESSGQNQPVQVIGTQSPSHRV